MSSNKDIPTNSSQRVQSAGDQKFIQMSLCGSFSFRTPTYTHIYTYTIQIHMHTHKYMHTDTQTSITCAQTYTCHLSLQVPGSVPLLSIPMIPNPSLSLQYLIAHGPSSLLDNKSHEAGILTFASPGMKCGRCLIC